MLKETTAVELYYLIGEMRFLEGARLEKVYQHQKKSFVFVFHVPSRGKEFLRVVLPRYFYLSETREKAPERILDFCNVLRRNLSNARLTRISQHDFERVVELFFDTPKGGFILVFELFSKGNAILCKQDYSIHYQLETQQWKDRSIRGGIKYLFPKSKANLLTIGKEEFSSILRNSNKESVVKTLAVELGLGGLYAEEACAEAGVDKNRKELSAEEMTALFNSVKSFLKREPKPNAVFEGGKLRDVVPFELELYKDYEKKHFQTSNHAIDENITPLIWSEVKSSEDAYEKEKKKLLNILEQQEAKIKELKMSVEENTAKAETIYKNYQKIQAVLELVKELRKKHNWQELKEKLKGNKMIKSVDPKTGRITVEI